MVLNYLEQQLSKCLFQSIGSSHQPINRNWLYSVLFAVINVWGAAGIGKSTLVRRVASELMNEGEVVVSYVNLR